MAEKMNSIQTKLCQDGKMMAERLERLSADSIWAHRASGLRGSLLRGLKLLEEHPEPETCIHLEELLRAGHYILTQAAREIPDSDARLNK